MEIYGISCDPTINKNGIEQMACFHPSHFTIFKVLTKVAVSLKTARSDDHVGWITPNLWPWASWNMMIKMYPLVIGWWLNMNMINMMIIYDD